MAGKSLPFWLWSLNSLLCILTIVSLLCSFIVENKLIGTFDIDENGCFGTSYDTTQLYNGYNCVKATVGNTSVKRYLLVQNTQFEILNWGDAIPAISQPFEVQVKGYSTDAITDCKIEVRLDWYITPFGYQSHYVRCGTYSFNRDGLASFVIDPRKYDEGLHSVTVIFHKPGSNANIDVERRSESRSFRISHSAADSGKLRFWGNSAKNDRYVGEWADFVLKYDGSVTEQCQFKVTIDGAPVTPIRQGGDKVTDFFDKDGFCPFYLDVTGQSNGKHTVNAVLIREDGSAVEATNTVYITDGSFNFKITNSNGSDVYNGPSMVLENISGFPGQKCRFAFYSADKLLCDRQLTDTPWILGEAWMRYGGWGDENHYNVILAYEDGKYGDNVLKVVFSTPDGKSVEKNLPFQLNFIASDDGFYFYNPALVRNVGKNVDFTLFFDTSTPQCKALAFTLDGQPVDVQMPENPTSAFDRFGRFIFTLDLSDLPEGKHVIKAELTKTSGAVMTADQTFNVSADDYFELTDWKEGTPALHRVAEIKVKNLTQDLTVASTVRQYIDGEDMGAVSFDENGLATLALNTAGLETGEHWYKLIFRNSDGVVAERLMRFRVE